MVLPVTPSIVPNRKGSLVLHPGDRPVSSPESIAIWAVGTLVLLFGTVVVGGDRRVMMLFVKLATMLTGPFMVTV
jgi:tartrate dehydratase beta subunit/fumarate hydratase class I family protein